MLFGGSFLSAFSPGGCREYYERVPYTNDADDEARFK
jgi:hypothetical protein